MSDNDKYPYGYQLSFLERLKLRLKKINYRLSLSLFIAFLVSWWISEAGPSFLQGAGLLFWQKIWGSLAFLLLGLVGWIWMITGEMKKGANLTYRGKSIFWWGIAMWLFCWSLAIYIVLK